MKLAVAIATANRSSLVAANMDLLTRQTRRPDTIVVCIPDTGPRSDHIPDEWIDAQSSTRELQIPSVTGIPIPLIVLVGRQGLAAQRNRILDRLSSDGFDIVTFIDDDFLMAANYLEGVSRAFSSRTDYVVTMGRVHFDGIRGSGYSFAEGIELLAMAETEPADPALPDIVEHPGAYGCNMSIRLDAVGKLRFDERLPLYGWQEDIDFTHQLTRRGRVVQLSNLKGVHLGYRAGRQSGVRFGYSQITNPVYLMRKGTMPYTFGLGLMFRNLVSNISRSIAPEPYIDRRGRLRGNLIALRHVLCGRIDPEFILQL